MLATLTNQIGCLLLTTFLATTNLAQSNSIEGGANGGRVQADKPTVYLDYVCQDNEKVYLRIHNNTIWHINVITDRAHAPKRRIQLRNGVNTYALSNDTGISLRYGVEKWALPWEHVNVPKLVPPHTSFGSWIVSQEAAIFPVSVEHLRRDLQVIVRFNYEWEITKNGYTINDPEHRVSFRGLDFSDSKPSPCEK